MEVELVGRQAGEIRVLHKTLALGTVVILDEVRETSVAETEGNPLPLHVLLPHTGNDLGDVDLRTFGACRYHHFEVVELGEGFLSAGASLVSCLVEDPVDLVLKGLAERVPWCGLQLVVMGFFYYLNDITLGGGEEKGGEEGGKEGRREEGREGGKERREERREG